MITYLSHHERVSCHSLHHQQDYPAHWVCLQLREEHQSRDWWLRKLVLLHKNKRTIKTRRVCKSFISPETNYVYRVLVGQFFLMKHDGNCSEGPLEGTSVSATSEMGLSLWFSSLKLLSNMTYPYCAMLVRLLFGVLVSSFWLDNKNWKLFDFFKEDLPKPALLSPRLGCYFWNLLTTWSFTTTFCSSLSKLYGN